MRDVRASSPSGEGERNAKRARSFQEDDYDDSPTIVCQQPPFSEDTVAVAPTVGERVLTTALTPLPLAPDLPLHSVSEHEQYIPPRKTCFSHTASSCLPTLSSAARTHPVRDSDGVLSTVHRHGARTSEHGQFLPPPRSSSSSDLSNHQLNRAATWPIRHDPFC